MITIKCKNSLIEQLLSEELKRRKGILEVLIESQKNILVEAKKDDDDEDDDDEEDLNKLDLDELIDKFIEVKKLHRFEGDTGVSNFEELVQALGYDDIDSFLADNSGCMEEMITWIRDQKVDDWKEKLIDEIQEKDDD